MADRSRTALLLPNDPLEAYAVKYGSFHDLAGLSPSGVFDRVAVAYQAAPGGRAEPSPGVIVYRIPALRTRRTAPLRGAAFALSLARFVAHAARAARRERVDVIRAYNPFVQGAVAVAVGRLTRRPVVVSVHTDPAEILARLDPPAATGLAVLERLALAGADRVWCVTEYLRRAVLARGARPDRVRILPNRVPVRAFAAGDPSREAATRARYGIPEAAPVVVSVGRLDPEKDPLTLVRAVARVPMPDLRLVLVGDGSLREAVEEEAARAGLGDRLVVTGFRPRLEIPSFLHLADCFVMASRYEGFPFALAEALAAGVPVVASDVRQVDELLDGTSASRFPAGDAEALSGRITEVLADPARARAAAAGGRERMAAFDQEAIDALEAELYREVLGTRGGRR